METWQPAFGFESLYLVSSEGRVMRSANSMGTKAGKILKPHEERGYLNITLRKDGAYRTVYVHRLVMQSFTAIHGVQVNHKNGVRSDNRIDNLEWCTAAENLLHASRVLGKRCGSKHWRAKLNEQQVREIRTAYASGESVASLSRRFPVNHASISRIVSGKTWRNEVLRS